MIETIGLILLAGMSAALLFCTALLCFFLFMVVRNLWKMSP